MRILSFSSHAFFTPHIETELEIIQSHLDKGDVVGQFSCYTGLKRCDVNFEKKIELCLQCLSKRQKGLDLLQGKIELFDIARWLSFKDYKKLASLQLRFKNIEELFNYRFEGFDLGAAVEASLTFYFRRSKIDTQAEETAIRDYILDTAKVYLGTRNLIRKFQPNRVYVFNGRLAHNRAVFRSCQTEGIECFLHERGYKRQTYRIFRNHSFSSLRDLERLAIDKWKEPNPLKAEIGKKYFQDRASGVEFFGQKFQKNQVIGRLPASWKEENKNVVIFGSCDAEKAAMGEKMSADIYKSQLEAVEKISLSLSPDPIFHVFLRLHPYLQFFDQEEEEIFLSLKYPNLSIIPSQSSVSTYEMMRKAYRVITFGSETGIEAVFWGRVSILIGDSPYRNFEATYNPSSHAELISLIKEDIPPKDKTGALMYGYHQETFGTPFRFFRATSANDGEFRGVVLDTQLNPIDTWLSKLKIPVFFWKNLSWIFFLRAKWKTRWNPQRSRLDRGFHVAQSDGV